MSEPQSDSQIYQRALEGDDQCKNQQPTHHHPALCFSGSRTKERLNLQRGGLRIVGLIQAGIEKVALQRGKATCKLLSVRRLRRD